MRKNTLNSLLILVLLLMTVACKSRKIIVKPPVVVETPPVTINKKKENLALLKSKDITYNTLSLKGKTMLDIDGNENNVNMTIRIKKDEKIWISITAIAGIEVARALITPDSLSVLNRLQSKAIQKPFSYVYNFAGRQVNFGMLQSLLSGNTINDFTNEQAELALNSGVFTLSGDKGNLAFQILFNTLLKSAEINLNDVRAGQALKVIYPGYQQVDGYTVPSVVKINSFSGKRKINITFDFSKIERNVQLDFPFTVPKRFEIIN
jgi:hypothetical protein